MAGSTEIGGVILVCYVIFVLAKSDIFGLYEGQQLLLALVALSAGTQLGGL